MNDKKPSVRAISSVAVFAAVIFGFTVLNRVLTPPVISQSERRPLATMPPISAEGIASAKFMDGFENFAADSFAFRDGFRTIRAAVTLGAFAQSDKDGLYIGDSGAGKFQKLDEKSARNVGRKIAAVADTLGGLNVYYTFVPDKSVYAGRYMPGFDPETAERILAEELPDSRYIDITGALSGGDFYRTDLHWSQPRIGGVVGCLAGAMGFEFAPMGAPVTAGTFSGVYSGQIALPLAPDVMEYIPMTDGVTVEYINENTLAWEPGEAYDTAAFGGRDPYDLFLSGSKPLVRIDNPAAPTDRELYLFRDSFGSSLAPLLAGSYRRVTLIDLRYVDSRVLPELMTFAPGSDALFIYSSQILNSDSALLVTDTR
ncbi:MAG: hypothetical protein LBK41_07000 [Clostridiales bacterium]|nr:hypothetical protein [Clostridiales bacterium]